MNILFFLTPKEEVAYIYDTDSLRQALEKMEHHSFAAVPIISRADGHYVGTLTEGDLLWSIKDRGNLSLKLSEDISIMEVRRKWDNEPVDVDVNMEDLLNKAMNQNFVPVIDDRKRFIGIITRKDLIQYLCRKLVTVQLEAGGMSIRK
ncbi:MAG: CBS domain-containing protein [Lachnospiraceae bacterium]|jgi:FOG: CBS domain|nr:CBS domain-containing protein [Lachnospiraceae bacterium]